MHGFQICVFEVCDTEGFFLAVDVAVMGESAITCRFCVAAWFYSVFYPIPNFYSTLLF